MKLKLRPGVKQAFAYLAASVAYSTFALCWHTAPARPTHHAVEVAFTEENK
jgi:hypothetical protein